jgi:arachidonate 15-lipoxygenase
MKPLLPQNDPQAVARAAAIAEARNQYRFAHDIYPGVALAAEVPKGEVPPAEWSAVINAALKCVLGNQRKVDKILGGHGGLVARLADAKTTLGDLIHKDFASAINDVASLLLAGNVADAQVNSVDDYLKFFQDVPAPPLAHHLHDDATFSRRVIAGADPEILERVRSRDPAFPVTDEAIALVSPNDTWQAAQAEGRLYIADYGVLDGAPPNDFGGTKRTLPAPRVLFVVPRGQRLPRVCAIQIGRTPSAANPVFTTAHGWGWEIAKTHAAIADTIVGAVWFHHARTHLVAEPAILAAHRSFAPNHPVLVLLRPHFLGTLHINHLGAKVVFPEHGVLDWFTGTTQHAVREVTHASLTSFHFGDSVFTKRLSLRGVDNSEVLPEFPFRDDGLLVWRALSAWVGSYVELYYASDAEVSADTELQGWLRQWSATDGGGIRGIATNGRFETRAQLSETLAQLIFAGSAIHAAMNFPVETEMTVIPNSPWAAYAPPPTRVDGHTEADWLALLPPLDQSQRQFGVALLLGMARYGRLDSYPDGTFTDPAVTPLLNAYKQQLAAVEAQIAERNTNRAPYIHLLPSRIPQSINI